MEPKGPKPKLKTKDIEYRQKTCLKVMISILPHTHLALNSSIEQLKFERHWEFQQKNESHRDPLTNTDGNYRRLN